jgi:multiple antibiotic resistance protein
MKNFLLAFIPLFVAVDAVGVLPMFLGLTEEVQRLRRKRVITQSVITAATVVIIFILIGTPLLRLLGISVSDFMIAGGGLLFVISLSDLLSVEKSQRKIDLETVGAVPIGVPLLTGPAVLTTCILLVHQYGVLATLFAAIANVLIAGFVFWFATPISRILGSAGTKIVSKIASLLLASIAVMMVRKGIVVLVSQIQG